MCRRCAGDDIVHECEEDVRAASLKIGCHPLDTKWPLSGRESFRSNINISNNNNVKTNMNPV